MPSKMCLPVLEDLEAPVPRSEIDRMATEFQRALFSVDKDAKLVIAGSYRRGASSSGDIDILISSEKPILDDFVHSVVYFTHYLTRGKKSFMGICQLSSKTLHHRVDVKIIHPKYFSAALLSFTGSAGFCRSLRERAKKRGLKLNDKGLFDQEGRLIETFTEAEILAKLGVPPEERDCWVTK